MIKIPEPLVTVRGFIRQVDACKLHLIDIAEDYETKVVVIRVAGDIGRFWILQHMVSEYKPVDIQVKVVRKSMIYYYLHRMISGGFH